MSPESRARVARSLLVIGASLAADSNARAGLVPAFRWNAKLNGGYTGNVFYSQGRQKVSSYGGTVKLSASLYWKGPGSSYGGGYGTSYQSYSNRKATDLNSLSHNLTLSMNQQWSPNTQFIASAKANYTPEQDPFAEQDDPTEFTLTVRPRAQRTSVGVNAGWNIITGPTHELRANVVWGKTLYGDPVALPARDGQTQKPPQPFVDQNSYKASASFQREVAEKRRVDLTGSWAHLTFDQTTIQYRKVPDPDVDGDGTFDPGVDGLKEFEAIGQTTVASSTDSFTLTSGYSWELSELTRGSVGVGVLASSDRNSNLNYNWALSATINKEISPWASTTFGASRDQASFEGIGSASVGTRAFANFQFDTSPKTKLKTTTSYTRSETQTGAESRVDYLKATIVFTQNLWKWGGYSISYAYNDQRTTGAFLTRVRYPDSDTVEYVDSTSKTRFDIISFGLNFDPGKLLSDGGGTKK